MPEKGEKMKKLDDETPIQDPIYSQGICYDNNTGAIKEIQLRWDTFLKMPQHWQVDTLEWLLEAVAKDPKVRLREFKKIEETAKKNPPKKGVGYEPSIK